MDTIIYIVRKGDTLWKIAQKFGTTVNDIARYSGIADPDVIDVNQVIRIPVRSNMIDGNMPTPDVPATYVVKPGDTLWRIAKKYDLTIAEIINMNRLADPDTIYPGQVLVLKRIR